MQLKAFLKPANINNPELLSFVIIQIKHVLYPSNMCANKSFKYIYAT